MKTYKIDPLGKKRPLMLVRGTRLPEVFPDSIAENLVNSLAENSRGLVVGINGQVTPTKIVGDLVFSNSGSDDQSAVAMIVESWGSQQGVTWEDRSGQEYKLECNSVPKGELFGGTNPYYTGPYKDLKKFVRDVIPYTGQPLTASNCRQWFSYTTEDGVALTFRGCIQAQKQSGEYAGLKIDKIELGQETTDGHIVDIDEDMCITLDCDSPVVLGMPNGMKGSVPLPYFPGIGWLQIVATDEFKSHLNDFNESDGNGDAAERRWSVTNYDGFTYNIILSGIFTDPHQFRKPNNAASCRVKVKENSTLCNSTIGNADGYAVEYFGASMVNPINEGIYADVSPVLDGEVKTVDLPAYGNKYIVIKVPNISSSDEVLHVNIPAPSTNKTFSAITFVTMNGRKVAENELTVGDNTLILQEMPDMFAFFNITNMSAGTISVTISRTTEQSEPSEPVRTPGFYNAEGQLIKAMTKEEVETDYTGDNSPSKTNAEVKNAAEFVWPAGVTKVGNNVFRNCNALTSVEIPEGVTTIGDAAFDSCYELTSVTIPSSVTSVGDFTFSGCRGLNPLTVPNTVTSIGLGAFQNVPKVIYNGSASGSPWGATEVSTGGSTPEPGPGPEPEPEPTRDPGFYNAEGQLIKAFTKEDVETDYTINTCPAKVDETLQTATEFVWPAGVTRVGNYAFRKCKGLTSVTIPEGVTEIGKSVFSMCSGLTSIIIDGGITAIGESVFDGCTHLNTVVLPNTLESIGLSSFQGCSALSVINIPDSVTSLNNNAFSSCTSLNPLTVPSTVTTIGVNAFNHVPKVIYNGPATGSPWGAVEIAAS